MGNMANSRFVYVICFLLLFSISLLLVAGGCFGVLLFVVPMGFRSFVFAFCLLLLLCGIYITSDKQLEIKKTLLRLVWVWIPFIIYIFIRSEFHPVGLFKFAGFIMKVFFPCMAVVVLYVNNSNYFNRYFSRTIHVLNFLMAFAVFVIPTTEEDRHTISIWFSSGMAISIFLIVADLKRDRSLFFWIPLVVFFLGAQLFIGSRGPVVALLITVTVFFIFRLKSIFISVPLVIYAIFVSIVLFVYTAPTREAIEHFLTHGNQGSLRMDNFADDRLMMFAPTLKILKNNPAFGCGLGNWVLGFLETQVSDKAYARFDYKKYWKRDYYYYPHNFLLEIACELGLVGLALFIFCFFPFKHLFNIHNRYAYMVFMGFLMASVSNDLAGNSTHFMFNTLLLITPKKNLGQIE